MSTELRVIEMNKLLAVLAIGAAFSATFAQTGTTSTRSTTTQIETTTTIPRVQIGSFMSDNNLSWEDAAAAIALARATGVQPSDILTARGGVTTSFYELAPAYWLARRTGEPYSRIIEMYNGGQTWMDIARSMNVSNWFFNPDDRDTSAWTNADFTDAVWRNILSTHYAMTPSDYDYVVAEHIPWNEMVVAEVVGLETSQPARDIWSTYASNGNSWTVVQTQYIPTTRIEQTVTNEQVTRTETTRARSQQVRTTMSEEAVPAPRVVRKHTAMKRKPVRRHYTSVSRRPMRMARKRRATHRKQHNCCCCCEKKGSHKKR
jgi:hypothetical protein